MRSRIASMFILSTLVLLACQGRGRPDHPDELPGSLPQGHRPGIRLRHLHAPRLSASEELETPVLAVAEGALLIQDRNRDLLRVALESFLDETVIHLAVLVAR